MSKDAIAPIEEFSALAPSTEGFSIKEVMHANFPKGITQNNLLRVKVPAGGATSWEVDTIAGPESKKSLTGIIVATRDIRAYYDKPFDGSNEPPACYSPDAITGHGEPGGPCAQCPLSKWGSDEKQRGQACSMRRLMLILEEDSILPLVVSAPPGSLRNIENYFGRLSGQRLPHYAVVTSLGLEKDKNPDGIAFARIKPTYQRALRPDEIVSLKDYMTVVLPAFQTLSESETPMNDGAPY